MPGLYAAFGDKDALFAKAAVLYSEHPNQNLDAELSASSVHDTIAQLLKTSAEHFTTPGVPPGCLIMGEPKLAERRRMTRERITARLQQAVADGELSSAAEAAEISAFIDTALAEMASLARDGTGRPALVRAAAQSTKTIWKQFHNNFASASCFVELRIRVGAAIWTNSVFITLVGIHNPSRCRLSKKSTSLNFKVCIQAKSFRQRKLIHPDFVTIIV